MTTNRINIKGLLERREVMLVIVIVALVLIMGSATDTFLSVNNLMSMTLGFCADGFIAIAMTIILISGQIDLSLGSMICLSSMIIGKLNAVVELNIWVATLLSAVACLLIGLLTGTLIAKLKIGPFIVTLAMMGILRSLSNVLSGGSSLPLGGDELATFRYFGSGYLGSVPIYFVLLVITVIIFQFLLQKSRFFAKVYFIGSNSKAAELAGIKVTRTKLILYVLTAFLALVAGILSTGRFSVASPTLALGAENRGITAAVVGGTAFTGGEGNVIGTMLGVILVQLIQNSVIHLKFNTYWQDFVSNAFLILVIVIDTVSKQRRHG